MRTAHGVTLVELLVVLAMLGVMATIVGLTWRPGRWQSPESAAVPISALRHRALRSGRALNDTATINGVLVRVIAFPDGRIVGAAHMGVNPLTGESTGVIR